uniref:Uncharacterized protein n=1 Tax=Vespula pensylvanica TaxID=30213 RepID=A0A834PG00_VESPE|nr:hypothetical protein H0235_001577 [Vespula pensylvanica]
MNLEVELIAGVVKGGLPPAHLPSPRLIKIFIAGERDEFSVERKQLLEVVGPELQSIYDDMGIEMNKFPVGNTLHYSVLLVDMQYGTSKNPDTNPRLAEFFLEEINASHRHSRGCFLLLLAGADYNTGWVPTKFEEETFHALLGCCSVLNEYYVQDGRYYTLKASRL